jgi:CRP-like cAMP-binding protein
MRHDTKIDLLRGVQLFSGCTAKQLKEIARLTYEADVPAGRVLCREGKAGREAFVIVDGEARVTRGDVELGTLGPGTMFGELALLDAGPRVATGTASTPMSLLVLSRSEFDDLIGVSPVLARRMLAAVGARLRAADDELVAAAQRRATV